MESNRLTLKTFCTTREAAQLLGVSLRTSQLWVEQGLLEAWKTSGGHRRITRESIERILANPTAGQLALAPAARVTNENSPSADKLNILIVEDEAALRRLYEIKLRGWQIPLNLRTAEDGYEALVRIGQARPDMLIADLQMAGMDGFKMLNTICNMTELAEIEIVVVSGLDAAEIAYRGGIPKRIPVLPKPIPFDQLLAIAQTVALKHQKSINPEVR